MHVFLRTVFDVQNKVLKKLRLGGLEALIIHRSKTCVFCASRLQSVGLCSSLGYILVLNAYRLKISRGEADLAPTRNFRSAAGLNRLGRAVAADKGKGREILLHVTGDFLVANPDADVQPIMCSSDTDVCRVRLRVIEHVERFRVRRRAEADLVDRVALVRRDGAGLVEHKRENQLVLALFAPLNGIAVVDEVLEDFAFADLVIGRFHARRRLTAVTLLLGSASGGLVCEGVGAGEGEC